MEKFNNNKTNLFFEDAKYYLCSLCPEYWFINGYVWSISPKVEMILILVPESHMLSAATYYAYNKATDHDQPKTGLMENGALFFFPYLPPILPSSPMKDWCTLLGNGVTDSWKLLSLLPHMLLDDITWPKKVVKHNPVSVTKMILYSGRGEMMLKRLERPSVWPTHFIGLAGKNEWGAGMHCWQPQKEFDGGIDHHFFFFFLSHISPHITTGSFTWIRSTSSNWRISWLTLWKIGCNRLTIRDVVGFISKNAPSLAVMGRAKLCHGIEMTNGASVKDLSISEILGGEKGKSVDDRHSPPILLRQIKEGKMNDITMGYLSKQQPLSGVQPVARDVGGQSVSWQTAHPIRRSVCHQ